MGLTPAELRQAQTLAQEIWREAPAALDQTPAELAFQAGLAVADAATRRVTGSGSRAAPGGRLRDRRIGPCCAARRCESSLIRARCGL
jgi:hypothetical protein